MALGEIQTLALALDLRNQKKRILVILDDLPARRTAEVLGLPFLGTLGIIIQALRKQLEKIYGETRILTKPEDYILDQDHHSHLANQTISFDWQFMAEILFLEKIEKIEDRS